MDEAGAVAAAGRFLARGSDEGGLSPSPDERPSALYGAAKHALQLWCRRAAATPDWAGAGISLNVIALGFFDTPAAAYVLADPAKRAAMQRLAPLRGAFPGRPEEAAAMLAWCVSPENAQMTGQILFVDGGIECLARAAQTP
jgi:NAD(P)-dependent dehydrogenase (short-subunit alcohol dehydrogenase family)